MARPEQTEKPTPKRRQEARQKGQVPRSQELAGSLIFFIAVFVIYGFLARNMAGVLESLRGAFAGAGLAGLHDEPTIRSVSFMFVRAVAPVAFFMAILFAIAFVVGILANIAQFGVLFSLKPMAQGFSKLNPLAGFGRFFSKMIVVNLAKSLLKLGAAILIVGMTIGANLDLFAAVGQTTPGTFLFMVANLIFSIGWKFGLFIVIVGIIDYIYMRWQLEDNLKMSKTEIKDEQRQAEGNPEAKGALKRKQREFGRRRMMSAVPRATVVVTNPTHFAIALEWDEAKMEAPVVTAKGADLIAKRIRQIAEENHVPIMENPPLARTLYERVELDQAIPPNLYAAVAQVIAFVFKLKRKTIA
jgi:flagellar biosynthesis protein FlhB